jgi:hypothetical protein
VPGRLPDPSPRATEGLRRLQTEPLPRAVREPAVDDVEPAPVSPAPDVRPTSSAQGELATPSSAQAERATPSTSEAWPTTPSPRDGAGAPLD